MLYDWTIQGDVSTEKKTVTLRVPTVKTSSAFDVMEQTGGGFYREEECKIPMLVSSASNQVHFKVFPSLKDPVSLTLFKPSASHFVLFGTTLFLWELSHESYWACSMQNMIPITTLLITSETF